MEVTVIKSNRKTIAIQVDFNQNVTVRAPYSVSEKYIEEFLKWYVDRENQIVKL